MIHRKSTNHLLEIIEKLYKNNIDFIICGGVALVLHGIERMTMDLDLSISFKEKNISKFIKIMEELDLVPRVPVPADSLLDSDKREMMINEKNAVVFTFIDLKNPYIQVDVFLLRDLSFESILEDTEEIAINKMQIKIVSKKKLLQMKNDIDDKRDKDYFDIEILKKRIKEENEK